VKQIVKESSYLELDESKTCQDEFVRALYLLDLKNGLVLNANSCSTCFNSEFGY